MKANVDAICYRSRPLKNGEFPIMLRITKSRQRKYVSLGLSIRADHWDFTRNRPKRSCPNKEHIERLIAAKITEYNTRILELTTQERAYTAESLVASLQTKTQLRTVHDFFRNLIAELQKNGKLGNASVYRYAHDSLLNFTGGRLGIPFSDIDPACTYSISPASGFISWRMLGFRVLKLRKNRDFGCPKRRKPGFGV